jgi:hypothetical protein
VAAPAHAITISRAAEILGEDEELLWDMATDMEPEDGCLWIHGTDDQQTVAFNDGMQYLREMLPEYKRNRSAPRSGADGYRTNAWDRLEERMMKEAVE